VSALATLVFQGAAAAALLAQQPDPAGVRAAIDAGNAEYIAAYAVADPAALACVCHPEGSRLGANGTRPRVKRGHRWGNSRHPLRPRPTEIGGPCG
jgi:hypothetical protein